MRGRAAYAALLAAELNGHSVLLAVNGTTPSGMCNVTGFTRNRNFVPRGLKLAATSDQAKYPKAVESLTADWDRLLTVSDFPAEHWKHLRTTNPIESTFATVKLRTKVTKGAGSREAGLTMAFKLILGAEKHWRRFDGQELIPLVR